MRGIIVKLKTKALSGMILCLLLLPSLMACVGTVADDLPATEITPVTDNTVAETDNTEAESNYENDITGANATEPEDAETNATADATSETVAEEIAATEDTAVETSPSVAIPVDTHVHILGLDMKTGKFLDVAADIVAKTENGELPFQQYFLLPPPMPDNFAYRYPYSVLEEIVIAFPGTFRFLAGGESLNPLLDESANLGYTSPQIREDFVAAAYDIAESEAVGFGELAAEHLSFNSEHPYISVPPNHELFKELADIAAEYGMPIDLHMELAVTDGTVLPDFFKTVEDCWMDMALDTRQCGLNPTSLDANLT